MIDSITKLVDSAFGGIDKIHTSDEERLKLANARAELIAKLAEAEMTASVERHKADMASDSWLAKNIRPLSLLYILIIITIVFVAELLPNVELTERFVDLVRWLIGVILAYFGGRSFEKTFKSPFKKK